MSEKQYPADYPLVEFRIEDSNQHCEYDGLCSVHVFMAGKELLRYEAPTIEVANEYVQHLEHFQPRLNEQGVWELVIFTDSGFQTLYLDGKREPQCVMSHCHNRLGAPDTNVIYERAIKARDLAGRYLQWHERRYERITTKNMTKLEAMLAVLNVVLYQEPEQLDKLLNDLCPEYHVQKGVIKFSKTRPQSLPLSTGKKGTANG